MNWMGKGTEETVRARGEGGAVWHLAVLAIGYSAAAASAYVMPVIAGAFAEPLGFRVEDLGYVLAVELATITLGAFALYPRIASKRPSVILALSMIAVIGANLACVWTNNSMTFIALRGVAGLAEGVAQAGVLAAAARMRSPERAFTVIYTFLTLVLAAIFLGLPEIMGRWGYQSAFVVLSCLGAAGLLFAPLIRSSQDVPQLQGDARSWSLGHTLVLIAWLMFIVGQYALFVYAERIANHIGIGFEQTSLVFAIASIATIPAPWIAGWAMQRFGLTGPVVFATLLSAGSIVGFPVASNVFGFGAVFLAFNCAVFFAFPVISTLGAKVDASGRVPSLLPAAQAVGMVLGPVIASATLGLLHDYFVLALIAALVSLVALLAAWPAMRLDRARRQSGQAAAAATAE
jgi:predicted MFS family arabinose efflux permease